MTIVSMDTLSLEQQTQAAQILVDEFPIWMPNFEKAWHEVTARWAGGPGNLLLTALEDGAVIGLCGLLRENDGRVYEVHPLAVRKDRQRQGIGGTLLTEVTRIAKERGGLTLQLGFSDDKHGGETSLANVDLYGDLPRRIAEFIPGTSQAAFYLKHGFKIIGVMPDQYGIGKPGITMGKRLWE